MNPSEKRALMEWYVLSGVDETIASEPTNWLQAPKLVAVPPPEAAPMARTTVEAPAPPPALAIATPRPTSSPHFMPHPEALALARRLADQADTLDALRAAVMEYDGCPLKKTATNTVFADGNPAARVMLIGEAPGATEDEQGIPFCGVSGQLLDKMLASISLRRADNVYITNTLFWRPPGNRQPTTEELAMCRPFVQKHIALINPALVILCGGTATASMLETPLGISRLRGRMHAYSTPYLAQPVPAVVLYHPSYLLRTPSQKRAAWQDLLFMQDWLEKNGVSLQV